MRRKPIRKGFYFINHKLEEIILVYRFMFLFLLMMSFFILKSVSPDEYLRYVTSLTFLILVFYSLCIISRKHPWLWQLGLIIGIFLLISASIDLIWPNEILSLFILLIALLFYSLMFYICIFVSLQGQIISVTALFGPLCGYLFMGLFFASIGTLFYTLDPSSYKNIGSHIDDDFVYYSFITLTTLGYGDIVPVSSLAKTFAWIEAYLGQAYLTVLMALMVGRYLKNK